MHNHTPENTKFEETFFKNVPSIYKLANIFQTKLYQGIQSAIKE
jgi:hypothetical protein